jgi:hypothetical protein
MVCDTDCMGLCAAITVIYDCRTVRKCVLFSQPSICFSDATGICDAGRLFDRVCKFFIDIWQTPCLGGTAHRRGATCLEPDGRQNISKRQIGTRRHDRILAAEGSTCLGPAEPTAENCSAPSGFRSDQLLLLLRHCDESVPCQGCLFTN